MRFSNDINDCNNEYARFTSRKIANTGWIQLYMA